MEIFNFKISWHYLCLLKAGHKSFQTWKCRKGKTFHRMRNRLPNWPTWLDRTPIQSEWQRWHNWGPGQPVRLRQRERAYTFFPVSDVWTFSRRLFRAVFFYFFFFSSDMQVRLDHAVWETAIRTYFSRSPLFSKKEKEFTLCDHSSKHVHCSKSKRNEPQLHRYFAEHFLNKLEVVESLEDNVHLAHDRKTTRYSALVTACEENSFKTHMFALEVVCLGYCPHSFLHCFEALGLPKSAARQIESEASKTALHSSHVLFLPRGMPTWECQAVLYWTMLTSRSFRFFCLHLLCHFRFAPFAPRDNSFRFQAYTQHPLAFRILQLSDVGRTVTVLNCVLQFFARFPQD